MLHVIFLIDFLYMHLHIIGSVTGAYGGPLICLLTISLSRVSGSLGLPLKRELINLESLYLTMSETFKIWHSLCIVSLYNWFTSKKYKKFVSYYCLQELFIAQITIKYLLNWVQLTFACDSSCWYESVWKDFKLLPNSENWMIATHLIGRCIFKGTLIW